jgi:hypothetical protein
MRKFLIYYGNMWYDFEMIIKIIEYLKTFIKHCNQWTFILGEIFEM